MATYDARGKKGAPIWPDDNVVGYAIYGLRCLWNDLRSCARWLTTRWKQ